MTSIQAIHKVEDKVYITVRIYTACCKKLFVVEQRPNGFWDIELQQYVPFGARDSIRIALNMLEKLQNAQKINKT